MQTQQAKDSIIHKQTKAIQKKKTSKTLISEFKHENAYYELKLLRTWSKCW
jgi:hypothetical protein